MTSQQTEPTPAPRTTIADARCVFITGATSGLGRALALAVADLPSHPTVIAAGRRKDRLDAMAKVPGVEPIFFELAKSPGELKEAVDDLLARFPEVCSMSKVQSGTCLLTVATSWIPSSSTREYSTRLN